MPATLIEALPPPRLTPEGFQRELYTILIGPSSFDAKGRQVVSLLEAQNHRISEQIFSFTHQHIEKIQLLKEKGWTRLKAELGIAMRTEIGCDGCSFESFRSQAVEAVKNVCLDTLREMGYSHPGDHIAVGTPGYASDIDTVYIASKEVSEEAKMTEKILFDLIWHTAFGRLPGEEASVESYLDHPGAVFDTQNLMKTREAKAHFCFLEMSLTALQMYRALQHDPEKWQNYLRREQGCLEEMKGDVSFPEPLDRDMLRTLFSIEKGAENFALEIQVGVIKQVLDEERVPTLQPLAEMTFDEICKEKESITYQRLLQRKPNIEKMAMMNYKIPRLLSLSRQMDKNMRKVALLSKTLLNPLLPANEVTSIEKKVESLHLKIAARGALRNVFFDESYLTQGAYNTVCLLSHGQLYQRQKEAILHERQRQMDGIAPLFQQLSLHVSPKQRRQPCLQEYVSSQQENLSMYFGHFYQASSHDAIYSFIHASKYSKRALFATVKILDALEERISCSYRERFLELRQQSSYLYRIVSDLEKCKRRVYINGIATKILLSREVITPETTAERRKDLEKKIEELTTMGEPDGIMTDDTLLPQEKLLLMTSALIGIGCAKIPLHAPLATFTPRLNAILRARCGFPIVEQSVGGKVVHLDLQRIHHEAERITIDELGLQNPEEILHLNASIEDVLNKVRNFCLEIGALSLPLALNADTISLQLLCQKAERWM